MTLVERLGYKTLANLYAELDANDIMEWAAYDRTQSPDWREDKIKERKLEAQRGQSLEEEAAAIKAMFSGFR